jgi:DNA-binding transcriptional MerR regulator
MVEDERTYTLDEIEELTDFEKRTIVYYVQEGLLPKVGRRGPRTRYPQIFLDRLLFIKKIRELQDTGAMGSMTLGEIRDLFSTVPDETVADVAAGREPLHVVDARSAATSQPRHSPLRERKLAMARAIEKMRNVEREVPEARSFAAEQSRQHFDAARRSYHLSEMAPDADDDLDFGPSESAPHRLASGPLPDADATRPPAAMAPPAGEPEELAEALARLQAVLKRQPRAYLRTVETWTRARITEELTLGARGLDDRHRPLLERVAMLLRRLMQEKD